MKTFTIVYKRLGFKTNLRAHVPALSALDAQDIFLTDIAPRIMIERLDVFHGLV
jgi:hypothetical protein